MDNKLLVALSKLGQQQATFTEATNNVIDQLPDYVSTHPSSGITYRVSDIVLSAHSAASCLNGKACSRTDAHIMPS